MFYGEVGGTITGFTHPAVNWPEFARAAGASTGPRTHIGEMNPDQTAPYNVDEPAGAYNYNRPQSWPNVRYYFNFKSRKEVRVEAGGQTDYTYSWTPRIALCRNLLDPGEWWPVENAVVTPYNQSTLRGIEQWKGLNGIALMIELRGVDGIWRAVAPPAALHAGVTPAQVTYTWTQYVSASGGAYPRMVSNYFEQDYDTAALGPSKDDVQPLATVTDETEPTRITTGLL